MFKPSENLGASEDAESVRPSPEFSPKQREILLAIAHESIAGRLAGESSSDTTLSAISPALRTGLEEPRGVFTTLYLHGELRGCVGYAVPIRPLYRAVAETARAAAFEDTRFYPVTLEEAPHLEIELSVLSVPQPIQ